MPEFTQQISTVLQLRSDWSAENLRYAVEIETSKKTYQYFISENYNQALMVARKIFDKMIKNRKEIGDFGVMLEAAYGRGACYDINNFAHDNDFNDTREFYNHLVNEFNLRLASKNTNNNLVFRQIINENKLNEYQERMFLKYLKESK